MWNDVIISRDLPANVIKPRDLPVLINNNTCYHLSSAQLCLGGKGLLTLQLGPGARLTGTDLYIHWIGLLSSVPCRSVTLTVVQSEHAEVPGTVRHTHIKGLNKDDDVA